MNEEVSKRIEIEVLRHKLNEVKDDILRLGGAKSLKVLQDIGILDENFNLTKDLSLENFETFKKSKPYKQLQQILPIMKNLTILN